MPAAEEVASMHCPKCTRDDEVRKKGFFSRKTGPHPRVPRFYCRRCRRYFNANTGDVAAGLRKPEINWLVYRLLVMGNSQRAIARLLEVKPATIARRVVRFGHFAGRFHDEVVAKNANTVKVAVFDEMETFEHTKYKPVSIAIAVQEGSRFVLGVRAVKMPAKGRLAAGARKRYGYRPDLRPKGLAHVLGNVARVLTANGTVKSDLCPRYPRAVAKHVPSAQHEPFKGRRGCVVGQGELKAGGFDPLFSLNHSCAMYRDNVKRLTRRTWCTTKRIDRLQCLLNLYACAHNDCIASQRRQATSPGGPRLPTFHRLLEPRRTEGDQFKKDAG
jgi:transposase-like protein